MIRSRRVVTQPGDRLSEGVFVEAKLRAWLFGAPILRLKGEVLLSPVRPGPGGANIPDPAPLHALPESLHARGALSPPNNSAGIGSALAEAVALVEQSATALASRPERSHDSPDVAAR